MKHKILITGLIDAESLRLFNQNPNYDVVFEPDCEPSKLLSLVHDANVLITRSETVIDNKVLDQALQLKIIARAAVGVGNIDISYATQKGILIFNTPALNTNSAAEQTWGLLLAMMRKIVEAQNHIKSGGWDRHEFCGYELREKKIGIVGLGNVGHRVAKFAHGFDMDVYCYDPYISPELFTRCKVRKVDSLEELASIVEILTIHVPLTKQTKKLIDSDILSKMKKGSYLINTARGGVVCEESLLKALNDGRLSGAAIDTWDNEPHPNKDLVLHNKVWGCPHIGASTYEAQQKIGFSIYEQVTKALEGKMVDHPINVPKYNGKDTSLISCYTHLAEKIGSFYSQILKSNPKEVKIMLFGSLMNSDNELICLGFMKGYISNISEKYISYVNAQELFDKLGITISCANDSDLHQYSSLIEVYITNEQGKMKKIAGTVFEKKYSRITCIDSFPFEMDPKGKIIVIENNDRPGVIGDVGLTLASYKINIESFTLSRKKVGGKALALISVDSKPTKAAIEKLRSLNNIRSVQYAEL